MASYLFEGITNLGFSYNSLVRKAPSIISIYRTLMKNSDFLGFLRFYKKFITMFNNESSTAQDKRSMPQKHPE